MYKISRFYRFNHSIDMIGDRWTARRRHRPSHRAVRKSGRWVWSTGDGRRWLLRLALATSTVVVRCCQQRPMTVVWTCTWWVYGSIVVCLESVGYNVWCCLHDPSRCRRTPTCHGRTDGRTDRQTHSVYAKWKKERRRKWTRIMTSTF